MGPPPAQITIPVVLRIPRVLSELVQNGSDAKDVSKNAKTGKPLSFSCACLPLEYTNFRS